MKYLKVVLLIIIVIIVCASLASCSKSIDWSKYPAIPSEALFLYNTGDLRECVGAADYVFVAKVVSLDETVYERERFNEDGTSRMDGIPYTHFTVILSQNIKGSLIIGEPIPIVKHGGLNQKKSAVWYFEGDSMPYVGKTYVFSAIGQKDGSLLISGPRTNILVEKGDPDGVISSFEEAYANEVVNEELAFVKRHISKYDVNYEG